jgi:hypothetical protein
MMTDSEEENSDLEINDEIEIDFYRHDNGGFRKILKQLKRCKEIAEIVEKKNGVKIIATNGETLGVHQGSIHNNFEIRSWVRKNTSIQYLKI